MLAAITEKAAEWLPPWVFKVVTMFAVANTVLINYIMGSRLLYGMARQGLVPAALGRVHARRRTPHLAILTLLAGAVTAVYSVVDGVLLRPLPYDEPERLLAEIGGAAR